MAEVGIRGTVGEGIRDTAEEDILGIVGVGIQDSEESSRGTAAVDSRGSKAELEVLQLEVHTGQEEHIQLEVRLGEGG